MMMRSGWDDAPEFIECSSEGKDAYPSSLVHFAVVDFDAIVRIGSRSDEVSFSSPVGYDLPLLVDGAVGLTHVQLGAWLRVRIVRNLKSATVLHADDPVVA
jgi:hypothetical protein